MGHAQNRYQITYPTPVISGLPCLKLSEGGCGRASRATEGVMSYLTMVVQQGAARFGVALPKGLIRFLGVGMAGLATQTGVFTLLFRLGLNASWAWFAGLVIATTVTWALNRRFTFAATGRSRRAEIGRYALVTAVAQSVSFATFHAALAVAKIIPPEIDVIVGAVVATLFSYTGQRFFTFSAAKTAARFDPKA
jgi:putative flippase GtrA